MHILPTAQFLKNVVGAQSSLNQTADEINSKSENMTQRVSEEFNNFEPQKVRVEYILMNIE